MELTAFRLFWRWRLSISDLCTKVYHPLLLANDCYQWTVSSGTNCALWCLKWLEAVKKKLHCVLQYNIMGKITALWEKPHSWQIVILGLCSWAAGDMIHDQPPRELKPTECGDGALFVPHPRHPYIVIPVFFCTLMIPITPLRSPSWISARQCLSLWALKQACAGIVCVSKAAETWLLLRMHSVCFATRCQR